MTPDWQLPAQDRTILRELAARQADYAALPVMAERRKQWYALNDGGRNVRPPFVVETWTFARDFMPDSVYRCTSPLGRNLERQLLYPIRNHELIDDDKVMPDTFDIGWFTAIDDLGVAIPTEALKDGEGVETGYRFLHPIHDLERDLALIKPSVCSVDKAKTLAWKAWLEDLLGDRLPVRIRTGTYGFTMLTYRVVQLMGMEAYFTAMCDTPDLVHALMGKLRDNALACMRWAEAEGLLQCNNGNQSSFGSSFNFTRRLPRPDWSGGRARLCDMWGCANSQETVGVSPEMYHEFCFPYYRDVCEPMGLVYYGCCEPAHPFWEDIRRYPHLKKVSISRWCEERFMAEALTGLDIVYSRKPDPNFLSVDKVLDEAAWAAHLRKTLALTRHLPVEIIVRDVYTLHGNLANARNAVKVARREIDRSRE